mmetsp:Transcript_57469/g.168764  ORF Transcript_57469/g.168764 Transcript_57469/m.168764 type:complete len:205 (-) Transcript_57469:319-933(-)
MPNLAEQRVQLLPLVGRPYGGEDDAHGDLRTAAQDGVGQVLRVGGDDPRQCRQVDRRVRRKDHHEHHQCRHPSRSAGGVCRHFLQVRLEPPPHPAAGVPVAEEASQDNRPAQQRRVDDHRDPPEQHVGVRDRDGACHLRERPAKRAVARQQQEHRHGDQPLHVATRAYGAPGLYEAAATAGRHGVLPRRPRGHGGLRADQRGEG